MAYLQSAPSCLSQLSLNQTAVTEATLAVLPQAVPQLRLLNIKQTKVGWSLVLGQVSGSRLMFLL